MTDQNEVTVQELAQARKVNDMAKEISDVAAVALDHATRDIPEYAALDNARDTYQEAKRKLDDLEIKFKQQLTVKFAETGEKQHNGGSVAVGKKFFYDDPKVIGWLKAHNLDNLISEKYNKTDVKKYHSEKNPVDGITTEETITPKINKDLSEFLPGQETKNG